MSRDKVDIFFNKSQLPIANILILVCLDRLLITVEVLIEFSSLDDKFENISVHTDDQAILNFSTWSKKKPKPKKQLVFP